MRSGAFLYTWGIALSLLVCPANKVFAGEAKKPSPPSPEAVRFFENKIRPLLDANCYRCHGDRKKPKGNLRLDSLAGMLVGGDRGPAIVPGHPEKSLLIKALQHEDPNLKMPEDGQLPKSNIADLAAWIKMGAPWPGADKTDVPIVRKEFQISDKDRAHWAFQPTKRPALPEVKHKKWVTNPIDAFILTGLEEKGLEPNPPASKQELARRLYYDLTGLPPTPKEMEAFLADTSPKAYDNLVETLLSSPRYGEKWGRHWLDLVRFAETNSYERDNPKPHAWRYRDYVIRAFNQDKPYDQFIREQLAGDELYVSPRPQGGRGAGGEGVNDAIIATGFYRLGIWDDEPADPLQARYDMLDDIVATTGQVFLGLTFDCARCHDHKLDPIAQKDYYRLLSFFHNINHFKNGGPTDEVPLLGSRKDREAYEQGQRDLEAKRVALKGILEEAQREYRNQFEAKKTKPKFPDWLAKEGTKVLGEEKFARYRELEKEIAQAKKQEKPVELALAVTEPGPKAPETFVLMRGNPHVKGAKVDPAFPLIFEAPAPELPEPPPNARSSGRRSVLANWIASKDNVLTARVMANRLWQHHFGRGIVRSPNNFGLQGDRPTHPELLDWLASELIANGWRLKAMHRLIVTSSAYRMSSRGNAKALAADPANDRFWRFDMRRLSAEEIRDSVLAVTGNLNLKMFGPGIYPEIPKEVLAGQSVPGRGWGKSSPEEQARRSVYIHVKRSLLYPLLDSFDLAEPDRTTPIRFSTTQPTQALLMLNGEFLNKQAQIFADRLRREAGKDVEKQVRLALSLATSRQPTAAEIERGVGLIEALRKEDGASADVALKYFCLMVLNLNEFVYVD